MFKRTAPLLFFLVFFFLTSPALASSIYDMSDPSNFNVRFDGPATSHTGENGGGLGLGGAVIADIDNNGKGDVVIGYPNLSYGGRTDAGSVFVIYDSIFDSPGTGKVFDLNDPANYNVRLNGPVASKYITYAGKINVTDYNNDGKKDLIIAGPTLESNNGAIYLIDNNLLNTYSGTGNNIDLADSNNYNIKFIGASINLIGSATAIERTVDIDGDDKDDFLIEGYPSSNNGRDASGSIYLVYNTLLSGYSGTGNDISLADADNYNVRFDGAEENDMIGGYGSPDAADLDGNGEKDILIPALTYTNNKEGYVYVIYDSLLPDHNLTGQNIDLADEDNYNLLFVGDTTQGIFGDNIVTADFNNDGIDDFVANSLYSSNTRSLSGSVYLFTKSLLDNYSGTGNNLSLTNSDTYNLRFDGADEGDWLGDIAMSSGDMDGDGREDLLIGGPHNKLLGRHNPGVVYVIYNPILNRYSSGLGNTMDLADSANYSYAYVGGAVDHLANWNIAPKDMNNDGSNDTLITAHLTDYNGRTDSGSTYIIYNFPHTFDISSSFSINNGSVNNKPNFSGSLSASDSVTNISNIQYKIDDTSWGGDWHDCTPKDGSFNSRSEEFNCNDIDTSELTEGKHTLHTRAYDENTSYTHSSNYGSFDFIVDRTPSSDFTLLEP